MAMNEQNDFTPEDRTAIEAVITAALKIANDSMDWDRYCEVFYAADATLCPPNMGPVEGRLAIAEFLKEAFPSVTSVDFRTVTLEGSGDLAYVYGSYHVELTTPDGPATDQGNFIEIWKRQSGGGWGNSLDIFNSSLSTAQ